MTARVLYTRMCKSSLCQKSTAKSRCFARSGSEKGLVKINFSNSESACHKIHFLGLLLYRKAVRTNSGYRLCTSSILFGLVRTPALPPESPQEVHRESVSGLGGFSLGVLIASCTANSNLEYKTPKRCERHSPGPSQ